VSETIRLDVAAARSAFAPVRMVLGGLGARLGFDVDQLDDLFLATEELFRAALDAEELARFGAEMRVDDGSLRFAAGPFTSVALREQVAPSAPGAACLDLCRVLHMTCDEVVIDDADGSYRVVLVKVRKEHA
jgi:hypothetical protein